VLVGGKEELFDGTEVSMRNIRPGFFLALLLGFCCAPSVYAHHGNAEYDMKNTVTLTGAVTAFQLANPHSTIALDAKDEKGSITHWIVEFGVLRDLVQMGWTDTTLKPGDQIRVSIHPKSDGDHTGLLVGDIAYADGKPIYLKPPTGQTYHRPMHW
jgi:hypothetical protein